MAVRVRFAPSPTGKVHLGNIRVAIFNWLFARHQGGAFLLRIEDTDRERSTPEAIQVLLEAMNWLKLDFDEPPLYQSSRREEHIRAARQLLESGAAYYDAKSGDSQAILFRLPWDCRDMPAVHEVGEVEIRVHPDVPVCIGPSGVTFAQVTKKGKAAPQAASLAGFRRLEVLAANGECRFSLESAIDAVRQGKTVTLEAMAKLRFLRREIRYTDLVKGELSKPLDSMRDLVIVRSDGSPVFHLANVVDDLEQGITHIIRGEDHVENTYRHLFLFHALQAAPPAYAHLPMIVNKAGKPYSKRDGDAFIGDFRTGGFLPEALFNYLSLLGWSPGDDREKLSRDELVSLFSLERVQQSSAQMDPRKLEHLNGQYLADLPFDDFFTRCCDAAGDIPWVASVDREDLRKVAQLMQSRTRRLTDLRDWSYFFAEIPEYDEKACRKFIDKAGNRAALSFLLEHLEPAQFASRETLEAALGAAAAQGNIEAAKFNQPVRVAVTGRTVGAGVYETLMVLGPDRTRQRLAYILQRPLPEAQ